MRLLASWIWWLYTKAATSSIQVLVVGIHLLLHKSINSAQHTNGTGKPNFAIEPAESGQSALLVSDAAVR
jgi:hypothetical protein